MKRTQTYQTILAAIITFYGIAAPATATTISDIPGGAAAGASYTINGAEVVGILDYSTSFNNATIVLRDGTGSIIDFRVPFATFNPTLGDIINFTANNSPFQDGPELVGSSMTGVSIVSQGNPLNIPVVSIPQFNAASSITGSATSSGEAIVTLHNVHFAGGTPATLAQNTSYTLTDGTNTAILFASKSYGNVGVTPSTTNGLAQLNALGGGTAPALDVTGYVSNFFGTAEFFPLSATAAVPEPTTLALAGFGLAALLVAGRKRLTRGR